MKTRVFNFSAGPATLPEPALKQAQADLLAYPGAGASIMEISHRSKTFAAVHEQAKANIQELLKLPGNYKVLFAQGGASLQFSMLAMNLLAGKRADYLHVGSWAAKAMAEAKKQGTVRVAWSGEDEGFVRMPKQAELDLDPNAAYVHCTSNETIQGVEFFTEPDTGDVPLVCDASSDFLSRPLDITNYALLYAGAQKNVGPAGVAVVILRDDLLARVPDNLPSLLDYKILADKDSLYNTPPCFAIYMVGLVTGWLRDTFGDLTQVEAHNKHKANLLYEVIDNSGGFYQGHAQPGSRSRMNVTFRIADTALESRFIEEATAQDMHGLKGHRSVGGCRASIYNAMPLEGCQALAQFMRDFQQKNG
ncbi:MAG: 3-phosphoserine/phosphohydroxythreonine transaminase [Candidatus Hydrogenedentota bacterium]